MEQSNDSDGPTDMKVEELPKAVKARIERNRQKAVLLRRDKATKRIFQQIDQECNRQFHLQDVVVVVENTLIMEINFRPQTKWPAIGFKKAWQSWWFHFGEGGGQES